MFCPSRTTAANSACVFQNTRASHICTQARARFWQSWSCAGFFFCSFRSFTRASNRCGRWSCGKLFRFTRRSRALTCCVHAFTDTLCQPRAVATGADPTAIKKPNAVRRPLRRVINSRLSKSFRPSSLRYKFICAGAFASPADTITTMTNELLKMIRLFCVFFTLLPDASAAIHLRFCRHQHTFGRTHCGDDGRHPKTTTINYVCDNGFATARDQTQVAVCLSSACRLEAGKKVATTATLSN